ncbi:MAG: DNA replication and repair protein RecF [Gemmatimonadetes bacterium]|nr:DNA replication and repair protein RecF [Gemmatimonadota bacterium]
MVLKRLGLHGFRNLGVQHLEFPPAGVAVVGENAQGKTNLLEAIYYLEIFRSFQGAQDGQLVAFGEGFFRVVGCVEDEVGGVAEVVAAYERLGRRKKVTVNGGEPSRLADALGHLGAVIFSPSDVGIVSDGPWVRRRFLDVGLSLAERGYLRALQEYRQVLSRRNVALRDEAPPAVVGAWDQGLVRAGSRIVAVRRRWVGRWGPVFSAYYEAISGGSTAELAYAPDLALEGAAGETEIGSAFQAALASSMRRERRVGMTVVGPHRDDLALTFAGAAGTLSLREFASAGQRRTAALALRLVQADAIREVKGRTPLLLLDDVLAELDAGRSERVLALLDREGSGQVILTAPKERDVRLRADALARWRIRDGRVYA